MTGGFFYDERMNVAGLETLSPSAAKPGKFMALMKHHAWGDVTRDTYKVAPATIDDLKLVHDPRYVDGVFKRTLNNGFENNDPRVPDACLFTVGSMVGAVGRAFQSPTYPVCSPTSGFHHAGYGWGGGFCTFNGLMVAAAKFLQAHPGKKVGILDCDFHYGDGTDDILKKLPELAKSVVHHTSGKHFKGDDPQGEAMEFFVWLQESIDDLNEQGCSVVMYQAGADMHIQDPLGGILDDREMMHRDRLVFRGLRCGVAWNLAGGYRTLGDDCAPVLETHRLTYGAAFSSLPLRRAMALD